MLIFFDCVLTPQTLVQSSSLSYMGKTADTIFDFSDTLTLIAAFISTGIGLTILTPLGRIGKSILVYALGCSSRMSHIILLSFSFDTEPQFVVLAYIIHAHHYDCNSYRDVSQCIPSYA